MTCADSQRPTTKQQATSYIPQASSHQGSFHRIIAGSIYTDTKLSYSTTSFSGVTFAQSDKVVQVEVAPASLGFLYVCNMKKKARSRKDDKLYVVRN